MIVVDASLAVKWYLLESFTTEALALLEAESGNLVVPEIFLAEVIGALVRRANVDKKLRGQSETSIARFVALFDEQLIRIAGTGPQQMARAANLALDLGHPLKDCLYLALAMELGCDLVTADTRFAARAKGVWAGVRVLGG